MVIDSTVLAGLDNIVPVIIFLVVIGKIVGAIKNASSGASPEKPSGGQNKMETDLESFFQRLTRPESASEEKPPPPPPVPAAVRKPVPKPAAVKRKPIAVPQPQSLPSPETAAPAAAQIWGSRGYGVDISRHQGVTSNYAKSKVRNDIVSMMKDGSSMRKAVLLREILGPPVAIKGWEQR